jgi:hypothetical protein
MNLNFDLDKCFFINCKNVFLSIFLSNDSILKYVFSRYILLFNDSILKLFCNCFFYRENLFIKEISKKYEIVLCKSLKKLIFI